MNDAMQHKCKCGNGKFRLISELHFDASGSFTPENAWLFECTKCETIYDKNGKEVTEGR